MFSTSSTYYDVNTGFLQKMSVIEKRLYTIDNKDLVFFYPFLNSSLSGNSVKNYNFNPLGGVLDSTLNDNATIANNALIIPLSGGYLRINSILKPTINGISFCFFVKSDNLASTPIFSFTAGNGQEDSFTFLIKYFGNSGLIGSAGSIYQSTATFNWDTSKTYFIVWTLTYAPCNNTGVSTSTWKYYVDGVLYATLDNQNYPILSPKIYNYIGFAPWSSANMLNGFLKDFRVYNRVITAAEVLKLYANPPL